MWVVKLGGSLMHSPELLGWLAMLADAGKGRVVVVPGGGPFADQVRRAQARRRLHDLSAHRLALKATEKYGLWLTRQCAGLVPASDFHAVHRCLRAGQVPVWMADHAVSREPGVPATWDVTSDSLAAWCSARLAATDLVLVKSIPALPPRMAMAQMCAAGIVDRAFSGFVPPQLSVWVCSKRRYRACGDALQTGTTPGTAVDRDRPNAGAV